MKPLYSTKDFEEAKSNDKLPCECYICGNVFYTFKKEIKRQLKKGNDYVKYCSKTCVSKSKITGENINCKNCNKIVFKQKKDIQKNTNVFCSRKCSATFNNKNKEYGSRRSKLEKWIENRLIELYPNLNILYNDKTTINSELDIFIPSLNVAFELNGIFHYEPIYGINKLEKIKSNDESKSKLCHENKIDLCIINTSKQKVFKQKSSEIYLNIITEIINSRLTIS
jgi:hypothetical protein